MKILLIWPKVHGDWYAIAEPLALEYVAAGARLEGHDVRILDERLHRDALDATLREYRPDVVGVTGFSMHVLAGLAICRRAKELLPDCYTVVGGHHATLMPADFFEPQMDFVVVGAGVVPFCQVLADLERGGAGREVPGVWAREGERFALGGEQPNFEIDDLPTPDRTLVPADREHYFINWMRPLALARSTVGCPFTCNFCSLWRIMDRRYHKRDVASVVEELATLEEKFVFFVDDEAFIDGKRMEHLAKAIGDSGMNKRFFTYCRMDTLIRHRELMETWRDVGLERLFIGIEAVTDQELKAMNKRIEMKQVEEGLRVASDIGMSVFANFIVKPTYKEADFERLKEFIGSHDIDYPSFTVWTPIPGTDLLDEKFTGVTELQANGRPNWALFDCQNAVTQTALPKEEFVHHYMDLWHTFAKRYNNANSQSRTLGAFGAHARGPAAS